MTSTRKKLPPKKPLPKKKPPKKKGPQGIYCCPGTRIFVDYDYADPVETVFQGHCPECGAEWDVTIRPTEEEEE